MLGGHEWYSARLRIASGAFHLMRRGFQIQQSSGDQAVPILLFLSPQRTDGDPPGGQKNEREPIETFICAHTILAFLVF